MINDNLESPPLKTVVLFIFLHGSENLDNKLNINFPSNSVINPSGRLGLCVYGENLNHSDYTLSIIDYYKTLLHESKTINDFNYNMSNINKYSN